jgi:hypothetical protein
MENLEREFFMWRLKLIWATNFTINQLPNIYKIINSLTNFLITNFISTLATDFIITLKDLCDSQTHDTISHKK